MGTKTTSLGIPHLDWEVSPTWNMIWTKGPRLWNTSYVPELNMCPLNAQDSPVRWAAVTPFLAYANVRLGENE